MNLPGYVREALTTLAQAGFEAVIVGGCVRDTLMGLPPHDYDIATSAPPEKTRALFARTVNPNGLKHGTVTAVIDGVPLEITTYRVDGEYKDGRRPEGVRFTGNLSDDLSRRDFTVNAMAMDLSGSVTDPFGGRDDIEKKLIRCVGDPEKRFAEDALRLLRAARFMSRLDFMVEDQTAAAMLKMRGRLSLVSRERVFAEMNGLLLGKAAERALFDFMPLYESFLPVNEKAARAVGASPFDLTVRWAALLYPGGEDALLALKPPKQLLNDVSMLIRRADADISEQSVWPLLAELKEELFFKLLNLKRALPADAPDAINRAENRARDLIKEGACLSIRALSLSGDDLRAMGFSGRAVGDALNALFSLVLSGACPNEKAALTRAARALPSQTRSDPPAPSV